MNRITGCVVVSLVCVCSTVSKGWFRLVRYVVDKAEIVMLFTSFCDWAMFAFNTILNKTFGELFLLNVL